MGALKLDAQRVMVSLFGRDNEYVLAEATRTLSLQDDADYEPGDALWVGCCQLDYERSFCNYVFDSPDSGELPGKTVVVVPDMGQDARFVRFRGVQGFPHARFLASVPIVSPKGIIIGAYTVLGSKPQSDLGPRISKYLRDMAKTVMDYLETTRSKAQHYQAESMMVGIGSFLEGKSSLRSSWLESRWQERTASENQEATEGQIDLAQQMKQIGDEKSQATKAAKQKPVNQYLRPTPTGVSRSELKAASNGGSTSDSLSGQVAEAFSRAANIAREAIEVEGVAYFDANFGPYGSLVGRSRSDSDFSGSEGSIIGETAPTTSTEKNSHHSQDPKKWYKLSGLLAFSTSMSSSINREPLNDTSLAMPESLLRSLLHRYPRGKVFNFSEDGVLSSSDYTDGAFHDFSNHNNAYSRRDFQGSKRTRKYKKTRQRVRQNDAKALLQSVPGARSIIFMPLWDSHKQRWYSGCIAWTRIPQRVFSLDDELTFLFSLGNSVMAEVHRLGAEYAEQAKSDLLSSLSHEMRSPLHGLFGTVELLSDTTLSASQYSMVHTIYSCASTLLDTIDHLLDYARINRLQQSTRDSSSRHSGRDADQSKTPINAKLPEPKDVSGSFTTIQMDSILEQVVESVFAGYAFLHDSNTPFRRPITPGAIFPRSRVQAGYAAGEVKVILTINNAGSWRFLTNAGKWRLIVLNLLGNALKFTTTGYVRVSLDTSPVNGQDGPDKPLESQVILTVEDTGVGISKQYARDYLFTAFSQEDGLTSGNGLGLHVTRRTVLSLGGEIKVYSQKGVGTKVVTRVNLQRPPESAPPGVLDMNAVNGTGEITRGKSIAILQSGMDKADEVLCSSLSRICRDWLDMNVQVHVADASQNLPRCDYYIVTREDMDLSSIIPAPGKRFAPPVIVICSSLANASRMYAAAQTEDITNVVEYISQPCGPHKLAKTLKLCSSNQIKRESADSAISIISGKNRTASEEQYTKPLERPQVKLTRFSTPSLTPLSPTPHRPNRWHTVASDNPSQQIGLARTVLIVDDNEINLRILAAYMKKLAYEYVTARNGLEALEAFMAEPAIFKLILMGEYSLYGIASYPHTHTDNDRHLHASHGRSQLNKAHPRL